MKIYRLLLPQIKRTNSLLYPHLCVLISSGSTCPCHITSVFLFLCPHFSDLTFSVSLSHQCPHLCVFISSVSSSLPGQLCFHSGFFSLADADSLDLQVQPSGWSQLQKVLITGLVNTGGPPRVTLGPLCFRVWLVHFPGQQEQADVFFIICFDPSLDSEGDGDKNGSRDSISTFRSIYMFVYIY